MMRVFWQEEAGATMVEYAVLVALLSVAAIVIIAYLGQEIRNTFNQVRECIKTGNC